MDWWMYVALVVIIVIIAAIKGCMDDSTKEKTFEIYNKKFSSDDDFKMIIEKVCIIVHNKDAILDILEYKKSNIVSRYRTSVNNITDIELRVDDTSMTKVNRGSQVVGAAVGAALLGGAGLLLGGLTGSKRNEEYVKSISIRFLFDDLNVLSKDIYALKSPDKKGYKKDSSTVKNALSNAEKLFQTMQVYMKRYETVEKIEGKSELIDLSNDNRAS